MSPHDLTGIDIAFMAWAAICLLLSIAMPFLIIGPLLGAADTAEHIDEAVLPGSGIR